MRSKRVRSGCLRMSSFRQKKWLLIKPMVEEATHLGPLFWGKQKKTQWFNEILIFKNAKKIKFMEIELNSQAGRIVYLYLTFNMNTMVNSIMGCYAIPKLY